MKHERLIYIWMIIDTEVYLCMVRVLTGSQEVDVLEVGL